MTSLSDGYAQDRAEMREVARSLVLPFLLGWVWCIGLRDATFTIRDYDINTLQRKEKKRNSRDCRLRVAGNVCIAEKSPVSSCSCQLPRKFSRAQSRVCEFFSEIFPHLADSRAIRTKANLGMCCEFWWSFMIELVGRFLVLMRQRMSVHCDRPNLRNIAVVEGGNRALHR